MKVVAYIRVSTERQVREGYGLEAQKADIKRWAKGEGHRVVAWLADEGLSGANGLDTRVGLFEALQMVRDHGADALAVTSLDRLSRSLTQQEGVLSDVWACGARVFSLGDGGEVVEDDPDDPMRTAIRQMRGVFAQLERGLIRQRMRKGKAAKAALGGYIGGAPRFGARAEGKELVADSQEMLAVSLIRDARARGESLRSVAAALHAAGLRPKRGEVWHPTTIDRIARRGPVVERERAGQSGPGMRAQGAVPAVPTAGKSDCSDVVTEPSDWAPAG